MFAAFRKRDIMFTLSGRRYIILKDIIVTAETADYSIGWESEKVSYLQFHDTRLLARKSETVRNLKHQIRF